LKPTVYVETSVIGYYTARPSRDIVILAHQEITRQWWPHASDQFELAVSDVVQEEITHDDGQSVDERLRIIEGLRRLPLSAKAKEVAKRYLAELSLPQSAVKAAAHLAIASVEAADYLVTWNCKHIGNALLRRRLGEINQSLALPTPIVCTPEAMMGPGMIHDPIVKEVREAGGTMKGFCEMLRRKEKERKWPVFRRAARRSPKKK
jgi:hypothetical protein